MAAHCVLFVKWYVLYPTFFNLADSLADICVLLTNALLQKHYKSPNDSFHVFLERLFRNHILLIERFDSLINVNAIRNILVIDRGVELREEIDKSLSE